MVRLEEIRARVTEAHNEYAHIYAEHDRLYPGTLMPAPYHQMIRDACALLAVAEAAREYRDCHQRCMTTGCSGNEYQQKRGDLFAALDALEAV